jgi:hypothetical protein
MLALIESETTIDLAVSEAEKEMGFDRYVKDLIDSSTKEDRISIVKEEVTESG